MGILGVLQSPATMSKSQSLLKTAFHFNDADLRDNRNGRMSDRQKRRLRCMQVFSPCHLGAALFVFIHSCVLVLFTHHAIILFRKGEWFGFFRMVIVLIVITLMLIVIPLLLLRRLKKLSRDIRNGQVEVARGAIAVRRYGRKRLSMLYLLQIGGKEYRVMAWQMWAFHQNKAYVVYAAPQMQLVLSAERVRL